MKFFTNKMGYPSEYTRGHQIACALGCEIDTKIENVDDTVIGVKTHFDELGNLNNLYFDLIDSPSTIEIAKRYPHAGIIAITNIMKQYLENNISNKVVVIPEHSCNFERRIRNRDDVKVVGYVGSRQCLDIDMLTLRKAFADNGLEFKVLICETADDTTRKEVADFYMSIDIQIAYRLPSVAVRPPVYRNPLKIFNAGSFKIPTVAYPELTYSLCAGTYFLEAIDVASLIDKCYMLKNDSKLYEFYSERVYEWSRQFDIENIAKLYAQLSPNEDFDIKGNMEKFRKAV